MTKTPWGDADDPILLAVDNTQQALEEAIAAARSRLPEFNVRLFMFQRAGLILHRHDGAAAHLAFDRLLKDVNAFFAENEGEDAYWKSIAEHYIAKAKETDR